MKRLILVVSPPASGKTYVSKQLAKGLKHVVYLDKDTLIVLSNQIFKVAGQEPNRSSDFFEENIRNFEYSATLDLALEALAYDDIVLINAPFTREIRDIDYINALKRRLLAKDTRLTVVWVITAVDVIHQRMIQRNSPRDVWKIANWDAYIQDVDFEIPKTLDDPLVVDDLLLFYNSNDLEFEESMARILAILNES